MRARPITTMMVVNGPPLPSQALRVLDALARHGPLRFTEVQERLDVAPSTLDRGLKTLVDEVLAEATMVPKTERRGAYAYGVTRRGKALLRSVRAYRSALESESAVLGSLAKRLDPLAA